MPCNAGQRLEDFEFIEASEGSGLGGAVRVTVDVLTLAAGLGPHLQAESGEHAAIGRTTPHGHPQMFAQRARAKKPRQYRARLFSGLRVVWTKLGQRCRSAQSMTSFAFQRF